jgi:hypothetical protein
MLSVVVLLAVRLLLTVLLVVMLVVARRICWVQHTPGRIIDGLKSLEVFPTPPHRVVRHGCVDSILRSSYGAGFQFRIRALPKAVRDG